MPGPAEVASDEFANATQPFADWRDFTWNYTTVNVYHYSSYIPSKVKF